MSYANAIRDISPGSLWLEADFGIVLVLCAAAGYVSWRPLMLGAPRSLTPADPFRAVFEPLYDRERVRSQFSMSLANLGEFTVYWLPEARRIMCRSVSCSRRFSVPDDAVRIGVYAEPCDVGSFFGDLDDAIIETQGWEIPPTLAESLRRLAT